MITVILDREGVAALKDPNHPHFREVIAWLEVNRPVRRRGAARRTIVPTSIRVEAGWDRTAAASAAINQLPIQDVDLDRVTADAAARIRTNHGVSVADAHLGAAIHVQPGGEDVVVLTSDPGDIELVAGTRAVRVIRL